MLKLDIGCGGRGSIRPGFIGIDIWPRPKDKTEEEYIQMDFINDILPDFLSENSVDEALAGHIVEHLMPNEADYLRPAIVVTNN